MRAPDRLVAPALALAALCLAWQAAVSLFELKPWLLPAPTAVLEAAWRHSHRLASATLLSATAALGGLAISMVLGSVLSLAFAGSRLIRAALYPWAVVLQTVPVVAIAPLIVIWAGTGLRSVIIVATIVSLFPIVTAGTNGLLRVRREELELFAVHGATGRQTLVLLRLPHALPDLLVGARVAAGLAVVGTVVGELMVGYGAGTASLGTIVLTASSQLDTALLFAAIMLATMLGLVIVSIVGWCADQVLAARGEASAAAASDRTVLSLGGSP